MIGHPVRHSLSPAIFNAAFEARGLDWVFVAFDVAEGGAARALDAMRALDIAGFSVTMPHKSDVAAGVDELSAEARALGAVNSVKNDDGTLSGDNTDGAGFLRSLREEAGFDPSGRRCAVLGAGGAARAVVLALARAGAAEVVVVNRTPDRGRVAAALAGEAGRLGTADDVEGADLVVNATSVGMTGGVTAATPFPVNRLREGQVVADLIYRPGTTTLLAGARERGLTCINGLGMLVHQAALQLEWWTGEPAPLGVMFDATRRGLQQG